MLEHPGCPDDGAPPRGFYLLPGDLVAAQEALRVTTILGSCVAVCLFAGGTGIGGVCHYLLPLATTPSVPDPGRFGPSAVLALVERLERIGVAPRRLLAKVFGGASVLGLARRPSEDIGHRNVLAARASLAALRIEIVAEDVGGDQGRRLIFETATGVAWVKLIEGARP